MNRISVLALAGFACAIAVGCSAVTPPAPAPSTMASSDPATAVSFKADVVPILKNHCAKCHTAGGPGSGAVEMFKDSDNANYEMVSAHISGMISAIKTGRMPKDNPGSVPAGEIKTLEDWATAGAKNN